MDRADFKYELYFELSPDLLCIAGYDGYFKKVNQAVSALLGYSMEELHAVPINDFVYQDDKDITAMARKELTRMKTPLQFEKKPLLNFENRYVKKNGEIVWLAWTSMPIDSEQVVFAIAKDITHKKKLEAERNETLTKLIEINKDLRQLTYTTSHDLRAPVNNLLSIFSLFDPSRITDQETLEALEVLQLAGEKLKQTMNNYVGLLNEKHRIAAPLEKVDLYDIHDLVVSSISSLIQASKLTLRTDFTQASQVTFNKSYLESVFLNLITNCIKYARPGCLPVMSIHSEKENGYTRLIFSDNGLGFDMEKVKDDIFGLHQRFHGHNADSKGIGLYLVHSHVTSLGGKISVESRINEGTKFTISLKG